MRGELDPILPPAPFRVVTGFSERGFATESEAEENASTVAQKYPGKEVRVYVLTAVFSAPVPEPLPVQKYETGLA